MPKALKNRILVKAYMEQKDTITIKGAGGKDIQLWMGKRYMSNFREKNPVICEVIDNNSKYSYIDEGDLLLVHHNYLADPLTNPYCIEFDVETQIGLFIIPAGRNIFAKLRADGTISPICHNVIAERYEQVIHSKFIIIPDSVKKNYNDRVKVLAIAPEVEGIKPGETVLILDKADYEICYTFNNQEYTAIKVWMEDILAVCN